MSSFCSVLMKGLCIDFDSESEEALKPGEQLPVLGGRSGKWGVSPTNQPGFGIFEPAKSNTDFTGISKSPMETWGLEFIVLTPTIVQHCLL